MIQNCKFDKNKDISEVAEGLAINLQKAIDSGIVLDSSINLDVNGIENPSDVWTRVNDVFQAIDAERKLGTLKQNAAAQAAASQSTSQEVV